MQISDMTHNNLAEYGLDNLHCEKCNDTGMLFRKDMNGILWSRECDCMARRKTLRRISKSGLGDMMNKYSFENFSEETETQRVLVAKAKVFVNTDARCFFVTGPPGSGKTHICTAILSDLISRGYEARYFIWRRDVAQIKAIVTDAEQYQKEINNLKNVPVLYIDDLYKGSISDADKNLLFTVINDRYNSLRRKTIISTEKSIQELLELDEATGSRIVEMAKGFLLQSPDENIRLRQEQ